MRKSDTPTREMRSQGRTLQKYLGMLRAGAEWSQRNILGLRSFLRADLLDADRRVLFNEFWAEANAGHIRTDADHHAEAIRYILRKARNGLGEPRENCRFTREQLAALEVSKHHLLVGLVSNPRHPERWLAVYRAEGPKGAVTYVAAKYDRMKVLAYDPKARPAPVDRAARTVAAVKAKAEQVRAHAGAKLRAPKRA